MEIDIQLLYPEIVLLVAACISTLLGLSGNDSIRRFTQSLAAGACIIALAFAVASPESKDTTLFNPNYITILACVIGLLSILAAWDMPSKNDPAVPDARYRGEFFGMMLFSIAGVAMIGKVNDLIWLFIALELVSIPTYILVATGRSQIIAQEAGIKYFFLGALSAAIFLFGFSYLYGATGATRFTEIHGWFVQHNWDMSYLALIGLIMVIVGIAYKIAAFPLHFYTPDVYQGAATPVTAFLAFAPKTAGIIALISVLGLMDFTFTTHAGHAISSLLSVMAILTMTVGNVLALLQRNIKRIFAYSSIAHSGYMLVGLVAGKSGLALGANNQGADGVSATIFYLSSYLIMNLGAFAVLIYLQGKADAAEDLDDLAGVAKSHPAAALMMALCLFSLIGMPLTVGFLGKFYIIQQALLSHHTALAIITVINAAIAAAYYLKIIAAMYLREPLYPVTVRTAIPIRITATLCTLSVLVLFVAPWPLFEANNTLFEKTDAKAQVISPAPANLTKLDSK